MKQKWWLIFVGLSSVALVVIFVTRPVIIRAHRNPEVWKARENVRQLGVALLQFENEYGRYPDLSTATEVKRRTGSPLTLGERTSNDLFKQLLATGAARTESIFYAKAKFAREADNDWSTDAKALEHGECTFAYIAGRSAADHPGKPFVFGPVIPGTMTFDRTTCDGMAFILRGDNSVSALPIDASGKAIDHGMDFLDPRQPYWNGKAPDVKWPK